MTHSNDIQRAVAAVRANPRSPDLWVALGSLMAEVRERGKARDCYERALRLNPSHVVAQVGLAQLEQSNVSLAPTPIPPHELESPSAASPVDEPISMAFAQEQATSDKRVRDDGQGVTNQTLQIDAPSSLSLASRAVLALALTVGFYTMAIIVAVGLLCIPYAEWTFIGRIHLRLAFFCVVAAIVILWSVIPRGDRFTAPGLPILPNEHPKLFKTLARVAKAVNQEMPSEIYLLPEVNAWVVQRGGIMGIGGRRVMGLGLPLLQLLTVSQLRAVLAHEFGHYYGGDTKLGPWIYQTRAAIVRTVVGLAGSLIQKPFLWYGKMFIRVTHAVSRRQEFVADQLASCVAGSRAVIESLQVIHGGSIAFELYWTNEVVPVLRSGFRPPVAEGFDHFVNSASIVDIISQVTENELINGESDPYDTHPPLGDRIAAVKDLPKEGKLVHDSPAISLLEDVSELETCLLSVLTDQTQVRALKTVRWEDVGTQIYLPMWENIVRQHAPSVADVTPTSLPRLLQNLNWLEAKVDGPSEVESSPDERRERAAWMLAIALAVTLHREGWMLNAIPGEDVYLQRGEFKVKPFEITRKLASGELKPEVWRQQCAEARIT